MLAATTGALSLLGVVVALLAPERVYAGENTLLAAAATAQDLAGLVIAPTLVLLAYFARRGHLRAWLVLVGVLSFTVYNYSVYTFSLAFGPPLPRVGRDVVAVGVRPRRSGGICTVALGERTAPRCRLPAAGVVAHCRSGAGGPALAQRDLARPVG